MAAGPAHVCHRRCENIHPCYEIVACSCDACGAEVCEEHRIVVGAWVKYVGRYDTRTLLTSVPDGADTIDVCATCYEFAHEYRNAKDGQGVLRMRILAHQRRMLPALKKARREDLHPAWLILPPLPATGPTQLTNELQHERLGLCMATTKRGARCRNRAAGGGLCPGHERVKAVMG